MLEGAKNHLRAENWLRSKKNSPRAELERIFQFEMDFGVVE